MTAREAVMKRLASGSATVGEIAGYGRADVRHVGPLMAELRRKRLVRVVGLRGKQKLWGLGEDPYAPSKQVPRDVSAYSALSIPVSAIVVREQTLEYLETGVLVDVPVRARLLDGSRFPGADVPPSLFKLWSEIMPPRRCECGKLLGHQGQCPGTHQPPRRRRAILKAGSTAVETWDDEDAWDGGDDDDD